MQVRLILCSCHCLPMFFIFILPLFSFREFWSSLCLSVWTTYTFNNFLTSGCWLPNTLILDFDFITLLKLRLLTSTSQSLTTKKRIRKPLRTFWSDDILNKSKEILKYIETRQWLSANKETKRSHKNLDLTTQLLISRFGLWSSNLQHYRITKNWSNWWN